MLKNSAFHRITVFYFVVVVAFCMFAIPITQTQVKWKLSLHYLS